MESYICHRRSFLKWTVLGITASKIPFAFCKNSEPMWQRARYFVNREDKIVQCILCPWECVLSPGKRGHCETRINIDGQLYSLVYGRIAANHIDPVEKKPFFHVAPGSRAYSIATAGCNLDCKFCQNWELAQRKPEELYSLQQSPQEIATHAVESQSVMIAYTYNEPTIFTEYMLDIATQAKEKGIGNVVVSSGYINQKPLKDLCQVVDAYKIDLKGFSKQYYRDIVKGKLQPVLDTLITLKAENVWTEIVNLIVPTLNDNDKEIREMCRWIVQNLSADVPVHFSRFYPKYKLKNLPPTPISTLEKCYDIALDSGLNYVYLGNIPGHQSENTRCPNCEKIIIERKGYQVFKNEIENGKCKYCQNPIPGKWTI